MPAAGVLMIVGGAAAGISTVAGALMVIGGVMSTVGYVTENKDLQVAGSVLGLIGGGVSALGNTGAAAAEGTAADLATSSASGTAEAAASGTGAAGTTGATTAELAAEGAGAGIDAGAGLASQTGTGATVTNVGGAAEYAGTAQQLAGNASQWSNTGVSASSGSIGETIRGVVNSKEFWNGAAKIVGGALEGQDQKDMNDDRMKVYRDQLALEQQKFDTANANANAVPALNGRLAVNPNATPFKGGIAPVYTAPRVAPVYQNNAIMGGAK